VSALDASTRPVGELPGRYALRVLVESDLDELHALIERNRDDLARWLSWAQRPTVESTREHIARALAREQESGAVECAIVLSGRIVGDVGLYVDRVNNSGAIGYWLDQDHRGQGVMTAAARALVRHGFDQLALNRVAIHTDVLNRGSRAVAERLGFQLEGVARQAYRIDDGRYSDDAVYSLLAADPARRELESPAQRRDVAVETTPRREPSAPSGTQRIDPA
jgi:ribosomal-protein-serine acetyltransferase